MGQFVVLLRGVNVGKGNKVPMAGFRAALEGLGGSSVQTLLNSGNAVFSSGSRSTDKLAGVIAETVQERFGVNCMVVVKSGTEFEEIVRGNPITLEAAEFSRCLVAFTMNAAKLPELQSLSALLKPGEKLVVTRQAAYLHCAGGVLESAAGEAMLGRVGRSVTTRNWATVLKLSALLDAGPATGARQKR